MFQKNEKLSFINLGKKMNQQNLMQRILAKEVKIQSYKNDLLLHKSYFSQLNWSKISSISIIIIPLLLGMNIGTKSRKKSKRISRYVKLIVLSIIPHYEKRVLTLIYSYLEHFVKNKLFK